VRTSDELHFRAPASHPTTIAPDGVAAKVTAWLNFGAGGSCPASVGCLTEFRRRTNHH
jgi:hypothetical protein